MTKLANGMVNEDHIAAVLKMGANWELILASGARITISAEDAEAMRGEKPEEKKPEEKKP